jgi:hypothetical protein
LADRGLPTYDAVVFLHDRPANQRQHVAHQYRLRADLDRPCR